MASSHSNGNGPNLVGNGASYIRVSTDQQDTQRQYAGIRGFEKRFGVSIAEQFWFKDEGWSRDTADRRPDFQHLIKAAEAGVIQWIVVDKLDRFGAKSTKQLFKYLGILEDVGCKLYDVSGKEWTGEDDATEIAAWVAGKTSVREQREKSHRGLSGKIEKVRQGEWQGGPPRLGFDVACYDRSTGKEKWRVVFDGFQRRLKVYPDGQCERFDGKGNFPATQPTEVLRIAPSRDRSKIEAARSVFKRFAAEAISLTALATHLNRLGFRNWHDGEFQSGQIKQMLSDPVYLGFYSYNKRPHGKFKRYRDGRIEDETNYEERMSENKPDDYVLSEQRLFPPLIDRKTWEAVQKKLRSNPKKNKPARSAAVYLAGMLYCGNCGAVMYSHSPGKPKYFCSSYFKHVQYKRDGEPPCLRNLVYQDQLEEWIEQWLDESGRKLDLVTDALNPDALTGPMQSRSNQHWQALGEALGQINGYLAQRHPNVAESLLYEIDGRTTFDIEEAIDAYRRLFSPKETAEELARLEAEHDALTAKALNVQTERAVAKVNAQLAALEARMKEKEKQRDNLADIAEHHFREWKDYRQAIRKAKAAMGNRGERGLRQRAEALNAVIHRIECHFTATGNVGRGKGKNAGLVKLVIHPVTGETAEFFGDFGRKLHQVPATTVK